METEELKEKLIKIWKPQKDLFREFVGELNGKTMDYDSCRTLEDFFEESINQMNIAFVEAIKGFIEKRGKKITEVKQATKLPSQMLEEAFEEVEE